MHTNRLLIWGISALLLCLPMLVFGPRHALAESSTAQVAGVGQLIDDLWQYVDASSSTPDDQFYAEFAKRAATAEQGIQAIYGSIDTTSMDGATAQALDTIRGDIQQISAQIEICRQAALNKDSFAFQTATNDLGTLVDAYNNDVDTYNTAQFGHRTLDAIAGYTGIPAIIFALTCGVFAWVVLGNAKEQDVARELLRRLRWYIAYAMLILLAATALPGIVYFTATNDPSRLLWIPTVLALGAVVFTLAQYAKAHLLLKRLARG